MVHRRLEIFVPSPEKGQPAPLAGAPNIGVGPDARFEPPACAQLAWFLDAHRLPEDWKGRESGFCLPMSRLQLQPESGLEDELQSVLSSVSCCGETRPPLSPLPSSPLFFTFSLPSFFSAPLLSLQPLPFLSSLPSLPSLHSLSSLSSLPSHCLHRAHLGSE